MGDGLGVRGRILGGRQEARERRVTTRESKDPGPVSRPALGPREAASRRRRGVLVERDPLGLGGTGHRQAGAVSSASSLAAAASMAAIRSGELAGVLGLDLRATRRPRQPCSRRRAPSRDRSTCRSRRTGHRRARPAAPSAAACRGRRWPSFLAPVMPKSAFEASPMPLTAAQHRDLDRIVVGAQALLDLGHDRVHVELQPAAGGTGDQDGPAFAQLERLEDLPGDLDLLLRVEGGERDADRVPHPVGEQGAEPAADPASPTTWCRPR